MILADKIMENRKKNGWSQEELADKLGVSRQSVSKWEGAQAMPDMKKILQMSELFGVSTDYLLKDEMTEAAGTAVAETVEFEPEEEVPVRVSLEEASRFLAYNEKAAGIVSTGVMLCIFSPVVMLLLMGLAEMGKIPMSPHTATMLGIIILLVMVALGVGLFILTGMKGKPFEYLEKQKIDTDYGVDGMVKERQSKYAPTHTKLLIIGVSLCILSSVPIFVTLLGGRSRVAEGGEASDGWVVFGVALLLCLVALGVKFLVLTGMKQGGFQKLLEEGDYTRLNKKASKWDGIYWGIVLAIYLGWSFISMRWDFTWIVWPIGGVLFAAYKEVMKIVVSSKGK